MAFPTETVYGLGADATNPSAIGRIFAAKGRPSTNPLIIHVANQAVARRYAANWPESAERMARAFWPGPLTLVLPKAPSIMAAATAGLDTVGLRAPDHPLTLRLLEKFDGPLAGPSANRSTRVSPTTAGHVRDELGDTVDLILDGGPCRVGIESTVLDLSGERPTILRPGHITADQIQRLIGQVEAFHGSVHPTIAALSPGQHAVHYAPRSPSWRFTPQQTPRVVESCQSMRSAPPVVITIGQATPSIAQAAARLIELPADPHACGQRLYATLRQADESGAPALFIEMPPDEPQWTAVRDRLTRATRPL